MASECHHCSIPLEAEDGDYCSFACKRAHIGKPIPCRWCDEEFITVGRYRHHIETECQSASESYRAQRQIVIDRDGGECQICGVETDVPDVHHILPRQLFDQETDAHWPGNMVTLCSNCHSTLKGQEPIDLFRLAYQS